MNDVTTQERMKPSLDFVTITERAALAASHWMGRGERDIADGAAVEAMRAALGEMERLKSEIEVAMRLVCTPARRAA